MLNEISLTNFRQFTDRTVVFGAGNTSLRGANEGGKSTIIEGFLYLVGGVKACRNNDFVTWGAKASTCKVEGLLTLQGTQIRATRGKSGAEIYVPHSADKPTIVGQNEVTAWFSEQLGASFDVIKKMCFAGQKEIGGLLDEGNTKAVEFIEDMSGLDIVEFFIGKIQATGKVGVTTALVERAHNDRDQLELSKGYGSSAEQNIKSCEAQIVPLEKTSQLLTSQVEEAEDVLKADRELLRIATRRSSLLESAKQRKTAAILALDKATNTREGTASALAEARLDAALEAELETAQARQQNVEDSTIRIKMKQALDAWPAPEAEWDEGLPALQKFVADNRNLENDASRRIASCRKDIAVAEAKKVNSSACGLCGKDVSEFPEVAKKNAALDAAAEALRAEVVILLAHSEDYVANIEAGAAILAAPSFPHAHKRPDLFEIDCKYVPFRVKWVGGEVGAAAPSLLSQIAALKAERQARATLERAAATAQAAFDAADAALTALTGDLVALEAGPATVESDIAERIAIAEGVLTQLRVELSLVDRELAGLRSQLTSLRISFRDLAVTLERLKSSLAVTEADLATYEFHNKLIEDLRKARPVVANRLWNMVLKAVSTYLTRMRNEPSIVERQDKTFIVNGKPYTSYSGSAIDLLALGIRIALTKIFVPGADMLVLDEPFAACTPERTLQCLAFAVAAGFSQTIIITHEGGTEQVFDHIVEV